ncbi:hypothetical protein [Humisphaera borealis]|uniref:Uncharacterized protein n=1 Tax=Humisphaera borealis TaxID=2807512 RepID=A0A7M2WWX6_9BACT|nr:hypothetical protein [Humisphaera borealis]QOV90038.1 hypothetical protein IPV69_01295 [Humisphaera borealis]
MPADSSPSPADVRLLPDNSAGGSDARVDARSSDFLARNEAEVVAAATPGRQLSDLPKDELENLAEEFGIDPTRFKDRQGLVAAIHDRRQTIAGFERDALLDVVRWGRRPVAVNASKEQLAQEIARIKSMRFVGLSHRGLVVLARMRGVTAEDAEPIPDLIKKLRKQEGFFAKLSRKRRSVIASVVSSVVGEPDSAREYQYLPTPEGRQPVGSGPASATIKEEIEDAGLFGGITNRIKKSADTYINQKLDEIETRIDRKLDEIDRRLAEWRDKEVANRIKILKITLWASVIVGIVSLIYSYVKVNFPVGADKPVPKVVAPPVLHPAPLAPEPANP